MRYASMRSMDISNGENLGVSLFVQGCPIHCEGCFNQEAWDFNSGKEWNEETENKFLELASKPYIKRISILGGEPLADENVSEIFYLISVIKSMLPDKKIWLYTGYEFESVYTDTYNKYIVNDNYCSNTLLIDKAATITQCDVVVDGPYIHSLRDPSLKWRGSSNQRVIDVQKTLESEQVVLLCD